jgi:hypothetical protein
MKHMPHINATAAETDRATLASTLIAAGPPLDRPDVLKEVEAALQPQIDADAELQRECLAAEAVRVTLAQKGQVVATLASAWATREIARILHGLYASDDVTAQAPYMASAYQGSGLKALAARVIAAEREKAAGAVKAAPEDDPAAGIGTA